MNNKLVKLVIVTVCLFMVGVQSLSAQEFITKSLKKSKIIKIEKKLNSERIKLEDTTPVSRQIYPFEYNYELSDPIRFQRTTSEFSPLPQVKYHFNEKNDRLCYAEYSWQIENVIDPDNTKEYFKLLDKETSRLEAYKSFYDKLVVQLEEHFGAPKKDHGYIVIDELTTPVHQRVVKFWKDDHYAHLHLRFAKDGAHPGLHRIVLRIYWE